jgi:hypothetical protein
MRNDTRAELAGWIDELYREGWLVKTLDLSGQPLVFDDGWRSFTYRDNVTPAEIALWRKENNIA